MLTVVIVANVLYGIPTPSVSAEDLEDPDWYIKPITRWSERLASTGIDISPELLQHGVRGAAWRFREGVAWLREPVAPVFRRLRASQQWGLFGAVTEAPDSLVIEVDRGEGFERLFAKFEPEHQWREPVWRYRRVRGIWDSVRTDKKPRGTYRRLAMWTARELFLEDPNIEIVRFKLERTRLRDPWEAPNDEVTVRAAITHHRETFRFYSLLGEKVAGSPAAREAEAAEEEVE